MIDINNYKGISFCQHSRELVQAVVEQDWRKVEQLKYSCLCGTSNLMGIILGYITLNRALDIDFDYGERMVSRGTTLYRIRRYDKRVNFADLRQWDAPPTHPQGRANHKGQEALYLGSVEEVCLLETHIGKSESYVLGTYECQEDIPVGGFLRLDGSNNLHDFAGVVLNAFLIAPARGDKNDKLFSYLDSVYGELTLEDFSSCDYVYERGAIELPFRFGILNRGDQYYNITNTLCDILACQTPYGIEYSSCYLPLGSVGIRSNYYNLVLYKEEISKLKFVGYEIKNNDSGLTSTGVIRAIIESKDDNFARE